MWWAGLGQQLGLVQNSDYSHWQDTKTKACLTSEGGEMEKERRKKKENHQNANTMPKKENYAERTLTC